jgi:hypothetical protein
MNASGTALREKHPAEASELYMAFELGEKNWKLALGDGARSPSRYMVAAGDTTALLKCVAKAKARCGLAPEARVSSCYEAGRDGFWLHRWLIEHGIDNIVVDSASIEVNRRARRAKTDRLDGDKLLAMLLRYTGGERRVWSVVRVPTPEQEDARRAHRELGRLGQERIAHINRIRALYHQTVAAEIERIERTLRAGLVEFEMHTKAGRRDIETLELVWHCREMANLHSKAVAPSAKESPKTPPAQRVPIARRAGSCWSARSRGSSLH